MVVEAQEVIPVLGVPVLVRPDILQEMLSSIDHEVDRLIVVDNGDALPLAQPQERMTVVRPGANLGVGASWNHIIRITPEAPWWAIVNFDIVFAPGDLDRLVDRMDNGGEVVMLGGFTAFGISRSAISKAGWFDENYVPAYFEDNDYDYRCRLTGTSIEALPTGIRHRNSSTIRESKAAYSGNLKTFKLNKERFKAKWGGMPYRETFTTPFDQGGSPRDCTLDIDRLRDQTW